MTEENIQEESVEFLLRKKKDLEQRLNTYKFKLGWFSFAMVIGALFAIVMSSIYLLEKGLSTNVLILKGILLGIVGALSGMFFYGYVLFALRLGARSALRRVEYKLVQLGAEELQENIEENFFTKLVKINFKYLDQYYLQTQEQAEKSFRLASGASITGLAIITVGIIMMFIGKTEPAYVTTAAGVVSEFVAAVFFYLYNRTVLKMSQYHQKLVITQNISLALKISEDMDSESKISTQEKIIDRLTTDINKYLSIKE